ncbi:AraC family transcriptional regulator [Pseudomonas chlororaphis]|uniref:AraC family transcription regulator n=1 Tax=Pseudomonas chlororaphis TaxID=587753 RepID=A0AAX3FUY3_9PSED|nr:AraC family transcriptional regulator [Pseudomonas chlororaphis]AZC39829.1 Transcriptional regulator, AraC family [Pseudomonas chlororaphis subsp. piscium]AZC46386.1 Transcriptional regulator, AraC family [Pseudomonas chlororaphis subsp. piscium]AZC59374.1 Transcriptional regulator, AraC family [Pseudomonas chlororaphis subsp. piscium]WDG71892.1 AraC family transcriptional regulator [Pseudomonas chlororaphis]WDH30324.1 AraC family transcriptional regulator [Pseudomonas chlororaphis]
MMKALRNDVKEIVYQPEGSYPYGLEVFRVSDLRRRTSQEGMRRTYGYTFYMLILVTEGQSNQVLDFESCPRGVGSLVIVRPGQAHSFGENEDWDGWILLVRPDFLWPTSSREAVSLGFDMERLQACILLDAYGLERASSAIQWMRQDSACAEATSPERSRDEPGASAESFEGLQSHLRYAFYALVSWLVITYRDKNLDDQRRRPSLRRFHDFKDLVEQHFVEWKSIGTYASEMGCTERSLTRAALEAEGISAKEYISRRLGLEAKRLLIHTDWPVGAIADKLGFKEATHFSKFFRRVTGCTPQQFRSENGHE